MKFIEIVGYAGTFLNVTCCIPQVIKVVREGHAEGLAMAYVGMALVALLMLLVYVLFTSMSIPLICNYVFVSIAFAIALKYKLRPRK